MDIKARKRTVLIAKQHFTQPPAHYTEATLVKALEEQGIGRPSTYAPTITTIIARRYVCKRKQKSVSDRTWRSCQIIL